MTEFALYLARAFAAAMVRLEPFEPRPALALAVSGGADSMALAILARDWVCPHKGTVQALVVDHGLRPESAVEAAATIRRLASLGLPARLLSFTDLKHGPALAERARIMRYRALADACREAACLHLLLGHQAADQVETLAMRVLRGSQTHGLAGMAGLRETAGLRLLRPLLGISPQLLRDFLTARDVDWIEDPSNQDLRALRPRLRHLFAAQRPDEAALLQAIAAVARLREHEEAQTAAELASRAVIRPEGFALLSRGPIGSDALRSLLRTIGGTLYPPGSTQITELAAQPRPATLAGTRILPAGRLGDGLLIVREENAIAKSVEAFPDIVWDRRFRLMAGDGLPKGAVVGKLGSDAVRFRAVSDLPSAVLRTLPAIRVRKVLAAVPHLGYTTSTDDVRMTFLFSPRMPIASACFMPAAPA